MKTLMISTATIVALASATLGSISALAKDPPPGVACQKMRRVAVGNHHSKEKRALSQCKLKLRMKGEAVYGANYWGYTDFPSSCVELDFQTVPKITGSAFARLIFASGVNCKLFRHRSRSNGKPTAIPSSGQTQVAFLECAEGFCGHILSVDADDRLLGQNGPTLYGYPVRGRPCAAMDGGV